MNEVGEPCVFDFGREYGNRVGEPVVEMVRC